MKKLLIVIAMFALVGGGVAGLWFFHIPPFATPAKKAKTTPFMGRQPAPAPISASVAGGSPAPEIPAVNPPIPDPSSVAGSRATSSSPHSKRGDARPSSGAPSASVSEPDVARLASVYEQMPADEATKIMSRLPDSVVEPLLRRMDEKQVGKVLTALRPERAAKLTLAMARSSGPAVTSGTAAP